MKNSNLNKREKKAVKRNPNPTPATQALTIIETPQAATQPSPQGINGKKNIQITEIPLNLIVPNSDNPRTFTDDNEVKDLSVDILKNGLIHPITVRKINNSDKYQLVAGERRFRAFRILNSETIPCIVKEFDDEQALEVMMSENLNREDLKPIDEAKTYQALIWQKKYTVKEVADRFGLSTPYVYNRLALLNMIPEIEQMVNNEEISLSIANEISKYSLDVQRNIYEQHLKVDDFRSWKQYSFKVFVKKLTENYSAFLSNYTFDKTECLSCNFNSEFLSMFPDCQESRCKNRQCLIEKQQKYVIDKTLELAKTYPDATINVPFNVQQGDSIVRPFEEIGLTITKELAKDLPVSCKKPIRKDFNKQEDYEAALCEFAEENKKYDNEMAALKEALSKGTAKYVIDLSDKEPTIKYVNLKPAEEKIEKKEKIGKAGKIGKTEIAEGVKEVKETEKPNPALIIAQLQTQDRKNMEICKTKIMDDLLENLSDLPTPNYTLNKLEQVMVFYIMLGKARKINLDQLGLKDYANADTQEKMKTVKKLTLQQKNIITRDFIVDFITENNYAGRPELLHEFMKLNFKTTYEAIIKKHTDEYNSKHANIEEKLKVLETDKTQEAEKKITKKQGVDLKEQEEAGNNPIEIIKPSIEDEEKKETERINDFIEGQISDAIIIEEGTPFDDPRPNLLPVTYQPSAIA